MSTSVSWNGSSFTVPATGEEDWGGSSKVDGLLISLAQNGLAKSGGAFGLAAEVDFGGTAGLKALSYKSRGTNVSTTGILRLANAESIGWRNNANGADLLLTVTSGDLLQFNGVTLDTTSSSSTLTNKKLVDASCTFVDDGDNTKQLAFQCSGITTATTRTWTVIDENGTFVGLTNAQTLTNKTLTSPTINTPTITVQDASLSIVDDGDATKILKFQVSGITTGTTRTATMPDANLTIVGTDTAQVLTNKDYDGGTAANTRRITFPKDTLANITALTRKEGTVWYASDTDKLYKDDGTSLTEIGSGSGGSINYIGNPDAESGTTGCSAYADAAAATPVDGTGGSPTVTITRTTSTPLRGTGSFLVTKDAANRQGEGVSFAFTIDSADQAKPLNVSFDYSIASGTFVSGDSSDIRAWIYDVTNSVLIPITPYTIQGGSGSNWKFTGTFQTASNSTSYRLILHIATTSSSAWTFKFDNVVVGPQIQLYGAPITDGGAVPWTPTGSWVSNTVYTGKRWRVGDREHFSVKLTLSGAPTATSLTITLPVTIDTTKMANTTLPVVFGFAEMTSGGNGYIGSVIYSSTTAVAVRAIRDNAVSTSNRTANVDATDPATFASGDEVSLEFSVPVVGYSSTVLMSNDTDTRVVSAIYQTTSTTAGTTSNLVFNTKILDTHNAFSSATYTCQVAGVYEVSVVLTTGSIAWTAGDTVGLKLKKNAAEYAWLALSRAHTSATYTVGLAGTVQVSLIPGDTLTVAQQWDRSGGLSGTAIENTLSIKRLSGPSAIAASEKIYLQYTGNGGTALTANVTNADWTTKVQDSHGAWVTNIFTAPRAAMYIFAGSLLVTAGGTQSVVAYKNGSAILNLGPSGVSTAQDTFNGSIYLLAGETLSFRLDGSKTLSNSATQHWLSIESQG